MYLKKISIDELVYPNVWQNELTVFHQKEFLKIYLPYLRIAGIFNDHHELIGMFYYFKKSKYIFQYIIPPPFIPYNGLVFYTNAEKEESKNSVIKEMHQHIVNYFQKTEKAHYIRFVLPPEFVDTQVFYWNKWKVKVHYTYQINLNQTKEELFNNLSPEKRKSIRKAEKDGIQVTETNDFETVKHLIIKTFSRQNKEVNQIYLNKILKEWANDSNAFAFVAYKKDIPVAITFCVFDNQKVYYLFGGYDNEYAHHGAGVMCMWHSILKSKEMGKKIFDFEGSMLPNVERYFRDFGGKLTPYYVCEKWCVLC